MKPFFLVGDETFFYLFGGEAIFFGWRLSQFVVGGEVIFLVGGEAIFWLEVK